MIAFLRAHRLAALAVAAVAIAVIVLYATGAMPDFPDVEKLIEDVAQALGQWTYVLVGVLAFLETGAFVGLVAPGETVVIIGGVIAGQGEITLLVLIGIVWGAAILGDSTSFFLGRRLGRGFILRHGPRVKITHERLAWVEDYLERHGGKTVLVGRFIGVVRALAPFIVGSSGLRYGRFVPYSVIGTGLWATTYCVLGYVFYESFDQVADIAGRVTFGFGVTVGVIVAGVIAYRNLRHADQRRRAVEWIERRPLLRPLLGVVRPLWRRVLAPTLRAIRPQLRFVGNRVTPGGLGLELTTALAVAGVGLYVFTVYAVTLSGDGAMITPADRELLDVVDRFNTNATLVDVAEVITSLGSFAAVATLVFATSVLLVALRKWIELGALIAGAAVLYVAVQLAKAGIDRPRPPLPLVDAESASYPSGHAAYSTVWVAVAVVVARVVPGVVSRATLIGAALVLAAAIGLTRIFLRVHYWSDVAGGWALGAAVFGSVAALALVVGYLRQNDREPASEHAGAGPAP